MSEKSYREHFFRGILAMNETGEENYDLK